MRRRLTVFQLMLMTVSTLSLAACASTERLVKTAALKPTKSTSSSSASGTLAPMVAYGASAGYGSAGGHSVLSGDTVDGIAWQYKLDASDVIAANNLRAPYKLTVGTHLKIPPPEQYRVRPGDSLNLIAKTFSVAQTEIVALNKISAPYRINVGQNLRLPRAVRPQNVPQQMAVVPGVSDVASSPMAVQNAPVLAEALPSVIQTGQMAGGGMMGVPLPKPAIQPAAFPPPAPSDYGTFTNTNTAFLKPVSGTVISQFGPKAGGLYNEGINIAAPKGTPVRSANAGRVVYVGDAVQGYGNLVLVKHANGYITAYAHLEKTFAKEGQELKRGQTIGTVGSSGNVDRAQLHFEIRKGRQSVDPSTMI